jgi:uncharacterized membrane protein
MAVRVRTLQRFVTAVRAGAEAAARELATEPRPVPPARLVRGQAATVARVVVALGVLCLLLVAVDLPGSLPRAWVPYFRLVCAAVLLPVGAVLAVRARRVRPRLAGRSLRAWRTRTVEQALELVGIVMLAVGVLELARGLRHFL